MSEPLASVVIGFKDWGLDRLKQCILSVRSSFEDIPVEVITSDYGSEDGRAVLAVTEEAGGRYVRTDTDGGWSRSRALNAGFAAAQGRLLFATDADMIFTPGALAAVARRLEQVPWEAVILQCRDLPPDAPTSPPDWSQLAQVATIRPRWGMGGLVGMHREVFTRLRGYDERMHTYGGEDIDYGRRLNRLGVPINWFDEAGVRMYHVWHPSTSAAAAKDPAAMAAIAHNRAIHSDDTTTVRNLTTHIGHRADTPPVVSIIADARPASDTAEPQLAAELATLLSQDLLDLEIVLVGQASDTRPLMDSLSDPRVRSCHQPSDPWWSAMRGTRGSYVLLHAPGSLHSPNRLTRLLGAASLPWMVPYDGTAMLLRQVDDTLVATAVAAAPRMAFPWAALLAPREVALDALDSLADGTVDPNQWVYALLRNGAVTTATDEVGRIHLSADTHAGELALDHHMRDAARLEQQLRAAGTDVEWLACSSAEDATRMASEAASMLRGRFDLTLVSADPKVTELLAGLVDADEAAGSRTVQVTDAGGEALFAVVTATGLSRADVRRLSGAVGQGSRSELTPIASDDAETPTATDLVLDELSMLYVDNPDDACWAVVQHDAPAEVDRMFEQIERISGLGCVLRRDIHADGATHHMVLASVAHPRTGLRVLRAIRSCVPNAADIALHIAGERPTSLSALQEVARP